MIKMGFGSDPAANARFLKEIQTFNPGLTKEGLESQLNQISTGKSTLVKSLLGVNTDKMSANMQEAVIAHATGMSTAGTEAVYKGGLKTAVGQSIGVGIDKPLGPVYEKPYEAVAMKDGRYDFTSGMDAITQGFSNAQGKLNEFSTAIMNATGNIGKLNEAMSTTSTREGDKIGETVRETVSKINQQPEPEPQFAPDIGDILSTYNFYKGSKK
jgi:hypothetical protein